MTYIRRKAFHDELINWLDAKKKPVYRPISGGGGIGKTTLLQNLFLDVEEQVSQTPSIFVSADQSFGSNNTLYGVFEDAMACNCPNFDEARTVIKKGIETAGIDVRQVTKAMREAGETAADILPFGTTLIKALEELTNLGSDFWTEKRKKHRIALIENPDLALINAIMRDFKDGGVLFIDGWDVAEGMELETRFGRPEIHRKGGKAFVSKPPNVKPLQSVLQSFGEGLLLDTPSLVYLAGRWVKPSLGLVSRVEIAAESEVPGFTTLQVVEYMNGRFNIKLDHETAEDIRNDTRSSPLLLARVSEAIEEEITGQHDQSARVDAVGAAWQMLKKGFDRDEIYGLQFYLFDRLLRGDPENNAEAAQNIWVLALPEYLSDPELDCVFGSSTADERKRVLALYSNRNFITQRPGKSTQALHDLDRDALLAYAQKNGWDRTAFVKSIHGRLGLYYMRSASHSNEPRAEDKSHGVIALAIYHRVMSMPDFEANFPDTNVRDFADLLRFSLALSTSEKLRVFAELPRLSKFQIEALNSVFVEENSKFTSLIQEGSDLHVLRLYNRQTSGDINQAIKFFEKRHDCQPKSSSIAILRAKQSAQEENTDEYEALSLEVVEAWPEDPEYSTQTIDVAISIISDKASVLLCRKLFDKDLLQPQKELGVLQFLINHERDRGYVCRMYERAFANDPDDDNVVFALASLRQYFGIELIKAYTAFQELAEKNPENLKAELQLAEMYHYQLGRPDLAKETILRIMQFETAAPSPKSVSKMHSDVSKAISGIKSLDSSLRDHNPATDYGYLASLVQELHSSMYSLGKNLESFTPNRPKGETISFFCHIAAQDDWGAEAHDLLKKWYDLILVDPRIVATIATFLSEGVSDPDAALEIVKKGILNAPENDGLLEYKIALTYEISPIEENLKAMVTYISDTPIRQFSNITGIFGVVEKISPDRVADLLLALTKKLEHDEISIRDSRVANETLANFAKTRDLEPVLIRAQELASMNKYDHKSNQLVSFLQARMGQPDKAIGCLWAIEELCPSGNTFMGEILLYTYLFEDRDRIAPVFDLVIEAYRLQTFDFKHLFKLAIEQDHPDSAWLLDLHNVLAHRAGPKSLDEWNKWCSYVDSVERPELSS